MSKDIKIVRKDYLPNIFDRITTLTEEYGLRVGQIMSIMGKNMDVDVFYIENDKLLDELDKFIERQEKNKK